MTTPAFVLLALTGATLITTLSPQSTQPDVVTPTLADEAPAGQLVTIVQVKAPWYAFDFLLRRGFREALPTYQQLDGLHFKAFSSIDKPDGTYYGGIYLWSSEQQARTWFSPNWFADVERRRHVKPTVDYMPVVRVVTFVASSFHYEQHESACVTVVAHGLTEQQVAPCLTAQRGLLRTYLVRESSQQQGAILLFASSTEARAFLAKQGLNHYDWYKTPVLLNNEPTLSLNH